MSTDFEKFIRKHRNDFDDATPSNKVWENVERSLLFKKEPKRFTIRDIYKWSAAAAIFFAALTSAYFLFIRKYSHENTIAKKAINKPNDIMSIAPEYAAEFDKVYKEVVSKQKELKSATAKQPELYQQFLQDLEALDSSYNMLKKQAAQTPNRDVIIRAMMQNLQLQAELLSRQLMIFNQFTNTKHSKNETSI